MVNINGATALVTGGQRGLGKAFVRELLDRGATKVYASARNPDPSQDRRIVPVALRTALARNGGGGLVDIHSALSWIAGAGAYGASKAAFWSATKDDASRHFKQAVAGPVEGLSHQPAVAR